MRSDLHNHTSLCNHATGSMEDYIKKAIEENIDIFGFSCHCPMDFDEEFRMQLSDVPFYLGEIERLSEVYKDKIQIKKSLEIDFLPQYLKDEVLNLPLDYRIGAVHFLGNWGFDNPQFIGEYAKRDINECWIEYFKQIESMANSGLFDVVAHFDLLKVFGHYPTKDLRLIIDKTLNAIKKANMAIEINAAGLRKAVKEQYPSRDILELCYEKDIPITFGSDAHSIEQIGFKNRFLEELALQIGYTHSLIFHQRQRQLIPIPTN